MGGHLTKRLLLLLVAVAVLLVTFAGLPAGALEAHVSGSGCCYTPRGTQTVAIGRNMDDRVIPYAVKNDYGFYKGTPRIIPRSLDRVAPNTLRRIDMWFNKRWINKQMRQGNRIVDIGEPPGYSPSAFYDMERAQVRGYWNYVQDLQP